MADSTCNFLLSLPDELNYKIGLYSSSFKDLHALGLTCKKLLWIVACIEGARCVDSFPMLKQCCIGSRQRLNESRSRFMDELDQSVVYSNQAFKAYLLLSAALQEDTTGVLAAVEFLELRHDFYEKLRKSVRFINDYAYVHKNDDNRNSTFTITVGEKAAILTYRAYLFLRRELGVHPLANLLLSPYICHSYPFCDSFDSIREWDNYYFFKIQEQEKYFFVDSSLGTAVPRVLCCLSAESRLWDEEAAILPEGFKPLNTCLQSTKTGYTTPVSPTMFSSILTPSQKFSFSNETLTAEIKKLILYFKEMQKIQHGALDDKVTVHLVVDIMSGLGYGDEEQSDSNKWFNIMIETLRQIGLLSNCTVTLLVDSVLLHSHRVYKQQFMSRLRVLGLTQSYGLIDINPGTCHRTMLNFISLMREIGFHRVYARDKNAHKMKLLPSVRKNIAKFYDSSYNIVLRRMGLVEEWVYGFALDCANEEASVGSEDVKANWLTCSAVGAAFVYASLKSSVPKVCESLFYELISVPLFPMNPTVNTRFNQKIRSRITEAIMNGRFSSMWRTSNVESAAMQNLEVYCYWDLIFDIKQLQLLNDCVDIENKGLSHLKERLDAREDRVNRLKLRIKNHNQLDRRLSSYCCCVAVRGYHLDLDSRYKKFIKDDVENETISYIPALLHQRNLGAALGDGLNIVAFFQRKKETPTE